MSAPLSLYSQPTPQVNRCSISLFNKWNAKPGNHLSFDNFFQRMDKRLSALHQKFLSKRNVWLRVRSLSYHLRSQRNLTAVSLSFFPLPLMQYMGTASLRYSRNSLYSSCRSAGKITATASVCARLRYSIFAPDYGCHKAMLIGIPRNNPPLCECCIYMLITFANLSYSQRIAHNSLFRFLARPHYWPQCLQSVSPTHGWGLLYLVGNW